MRRRWQFSSDGTSWRDCFPINGDAHRITQERDLDTGLIAFRKKLSSPLVFYNNAREGVTDYAWVRAYADDQAARCNTLYVRLQYQCSGAWTEYYRGKFSAGGCRWDMESCVVEVRPETVDKYTCLLESAKVKRNILQVENVTATAAFALADIEIYACYDTLGTCQPPGDPMDANWAWELINATSFINGSTYVVRLWSRVRVQTECVGGVPSQPPGTGWELLSDNCAVNGTADYVRSLTSSEILFLGGGSFTTTSCVDGVEVQPSCHNRALLFDCDDATAPVMWYCYPTTGVEYDGSRLVESVAEYMLDQSGCDLHGVRSDFFEWDPVGDAPGYASGVNYITGGANQINHLVILQKSDAIDPNASNPATIGEMTFAELMAALRVMFRCYWDIDDDGYLRVEHWHYWLFDSGLDMTEQRDGRTVDPLIYDAVGGEIPRIERAIWMEAQGRDFVGKDIVYAGPCVNTEEPKEWSPGKITTDIAFIQASPDQISRDGFAIMACTVDSGAYSVILDNGAITGNYATNAPLSWANLQRDFWTWDRYLPNGNMNGSDAVFDGFLPTVEQERASVTMCCELFDFNPSEPVTTALGVMLGTDGVVESTELDVPTDRLRLTIRYAY